MKKKKNNVDPDISRVMKKVVGERWKNSTPEQRKKVGRDLLKARRAKKRR
jgi:ABC-type transporter MlaC component